MIRVTVDKSDDESAVRRCPGCHLRPAWTMIEIVAEDTAPDRAIIRLCDSCLVEMRGKLFPVLDPRQVGGGKVGHRHPDQARRAAATVRVGSQLDALLKIVYYQDGVTSSEAAPALSTRVGHPVSPNQTATRMLELRERGLVEAGTDGDGHPEMRPTSTGNTGQVWVVTDLGRDEIRRLHS